MTCNDCRHMDPRSYAVPVCKHPKVAPPIACVLVARRAFIDGKCSRWEKR